MRAPLEALTLGVAMLPGAAWAQVPRAPDFLVNLIRRTPRASPAVAADAAGNFVVTWMSRAPDGDLHGIFARRHDVTGTPIGAAEFRVNTYTIGQQTKPAVSAAADGSLAFAWLDWTQEGSLGIQARKFDAAGTPPGAEFRANSYPTGSQRAPAVAAHPSGGFVVVWESPSPEDGSGAGIFAQRFDAAGCVRASRPLRWWRSGSAPVRRWRPGADWDGHERMPRPPRRPARHRGWDGGLLREGAPGTNDQARVRASDTASCAIRRAATIASSSCSPWRHPPTSSATS
jgi:hypothetical protein